MTLLVAFPFCAKDVDRLLDCLLWCSQLGKSWSPCLLVADPDVTWVDGQRAIELAGKAFSNVDMVALDNHVEGWIPGSNALFRRAAEEAKARNLPFLLVEPDAVPLKAGWVETIADAYTRFGKPFMGAMVSHQQSGLPSPYLEGVAVYPANAIDIMAPAFRDDQSWTLACASKVVPMAVNSVLFKHLWGEKGKPPTFALNAIGGTNVFSLQQIPPDAVIWHRCHDGSLIRLLRQKHGISVQSTELLVVLPFCNKDAMMFVRNVRWMGELGGCKDYECLMSYERGTSSTYLTAMSVACRDVFKSVRTYVYEPPKRGVHPATVAFTSTARCVQRTWTGPWLWNEYDQIPIKKGWLDTLKTAYLDCGKSFFGPVVEGMGHINGGAIYPADTPSRIPNAMRDLTHAWDMAGKEEMGSDIYDATYLMQHVWVVDRAGVFRPHGNGTSPSFRDATMLGQILPTVVIFHRCKDGTLIEQLRIRNGH